MNRSTREIERDVERTRSDIEDTVEALREKMSLGQIVDEASRYLRNSGGSEAMHNLAAQARANPLPLALVGVGLAWLMSGRGQPAMGHSSGSYAGNGSSFREAGSRIGETAGAAKGAIAEKGRKAGEAASSTMHQVGETASHAIERVGEGASHAYGRVSETASQGYERMSDQASRAQRRMSELVESEPLILAGLGLAVGAAIAALMPATRTETRLMGDKLDEWKQEAGDMAREEWEKTKSVAKDAASAAEREMEKGGSPAEQAERAARSAVRTAEDSAKRQGLGSSSRNS
jgi:ElaB/YqjD/DUF883 family membrane-anchored ribosome-binding protein